MLIDPSAPAIIRDFIYARRPRAPLTRPLVLLATPLAEKLVRIVPSTDLTKIIRHIRRRSSNNDMRYGMWVHRYGIRAVLQVQYT